MDIRQATKTDAEAIQNLYLNTFDASEAALVSRLAVQLLHEQAADEILSVVARDNDLIVGHIALSPVSINSSPELFGYILAPLAVSPPYQRQGTGSELVKHAVETVSARGAQMIFVYGDAAYYGRFGFKAEGAKPYQPPYNLHHPEGWLAIQLRSPVVPSGGKITCVDALNNPDLW